MGRFYKLLLLAVFALQFAGCVKDDDGIAKEAAEPGPAKNTVFVYMAANNNLSSNAKDNLEEMRRGVTREMLEENNVVVYYAYPSDAPRLIELVYDRNSGMGIFEVLKYYPADQNATDKQTYVTALADMQAYAPAEKYGIIYWSHSTGWLPSNTPNAYFIGNPRYGGFASDLIRDPFREYTPSPVTKTFGQHERSNIRMELADLAAATPEGMFDYMIFDCCLMGEAEVAYALKDKADYIVASPAEVLANGMPYRKIIPALLSSGSLVDRLKNVCYSYNDYYKYYGNTSGSEETMNYTNSATIALYDCGEMEALADVMEQVIGQTGGGIPDMNTAALQVYDRFYLHTKFDIADVVGALLPSGSPLRTEFEQQLERTVIYKLTTGRMINLMITSYSGMATYLPLRAYADINPAYLTTDWAKAVYWL